MLPPGLVRPVRRRHSSSLSSRGTTTSRGNYLSMQPSMNPHSLLNESMDSLLGAMDAAVAPQAASALDLAQVQHAQAGTSSISTSTVASWPSSSSSSSAPGYRYYQRPPLIGPDTSPPPDLPPAEIARTLIVAYFDSVVDPSYPLLHRGRFYRSPSIAPAVLAPLMLVTLKMASTSLPGMEDPVVREMLQIAMFQRSRYELRQLLTTASMDDFPSISCLLVSILLLMTWADARGLKTLDLVLQKLAAKIVDMIADKHPFRVHQSWDMLMIATLGVSSVADAVNTNLAPTAVEVLAQAWIDHWELQNCLWYLLNHVVNGRARRRDISDNFGHVVYSKIVPLLYSPPPIAVWEDSFRPDFDPRFCRHRSLGMAALVSWVEEPLGSAERETGKTFFRAARAQSRGLAALFCFTLRLLADEFLDGCTRRLQLHSPHALSVLAQTPTSPPTVAHHIADIRDRIEDAIATLYHALAPALQTSWNEGDGHNIIRFYESVFGRETGVYIAALQPWLTGIRMELRTSIGMFLSGFADPRIDPAREIDLDSMDLTTEYATELIPDSLPLLPAILSGTRYLESVFQLEPKPKAPLARLLVPVLLSITLFHVACFRRIRTSISQNPQQLQSGAFFTVSSNLGICLTLLKNLSDKEGSVVESVYELVKTLLESGVATVGEIARVGGRVEGVEEEVRALRELLMPL